jgi:acyl transferase domain-containing protein
VEFEPIAIIGYGCYVPGASNANELWQNSLQVKNCVTNMPADYHWSIDNSLLINPEKNSTDYTSNLKGGYLPHFKNEFDASGFLIAAEEIQSLDNVFTLPLHVARQALAMTQYSLDDLSKVSAGVILGNLSYPTPGLCDYAFSYWLQQQADKTWQHLVERQKDYRQRFMSGLPALLFAKAFGLSQGGFALDAACASSIHAVKFACLQLQCRRADIMFAGGVNATDTIFVNLGFTALQALSKLGKSRPFHPGADGLVPAQGGGMLILKRLTDAIKAKDKICAVIRGIGLSNDGNAGGGLLAPAVAGQTLAMQRAYQQAGLTPSQVSAIECHATGTPVGDKAEILSIKNVFGAKQPVMLTALKSNIGHMLTAAAMGAIIRTIMALQEGQWPGICHLDKQLEIIGETDFRLSQNTMEWQSNAPRYAAVNGFGMGGDNAHIILQQAVNKTTSVVPVTTCQSEPIAVIASECLLANNTNQAEFLRAFLHNTSLLNEDGQGLIDHISLPAFGFRFPPRDLQRALAQQLAILKIGSQALSSVKHLPNEKTSILIGMQCDVEVARFELRWLLKSLLHNKDKILSDSELDKLKDCITHACSAEDVLGAMPNVIACRLALQFNCQSPSFAISSEELSGIHALQTALRTLQTQEIDMALVGAVDMSCESVNQQACSELLQQKNSVMGDVASVLVLKRLSDAQQAQENILAIIDDKSPTTAAKLKLQQNSLNHVVGYSHCANGLLNVLTAVHACYHHLLPGQGHPVPWHDKNHQYVAEVSVTAAQYQQQQQIYIVNQQQQFPVDYRPALPAKIFGFSAEDTASLIKNLHQKNINIDSGDARLVIVAADDNELDKKITLATKFLQANDKQPITLDHQGIYYYPKPIAGKVGLLFASSNTSYPAMGYDLLVHYPHIIQQLIDKHTDLQEIMEQICDQEFRASNFIEEIQLTSLLSWLHLQCLTQILGIDFDVVMGHSVGELNAYLCLDQFSQYHIQKEKLLHSALLDRYLDNEYLLLTKCFSDVVQDDIGWENWRLVADVEQVTQYVSELPHCHLTIINTPQDCTIGGIAKSCAQLIAKLQPQQALRLPLNTILHSPEIEKVLDKMRETLAFIDDQHTSNIQCISNVTGDTYLMTKQNIITYQQKLLSRCVDFPKLIDSAWRHGVRYFIEVGPQNYGSKWLQTILGKQDYVSTSMDVKKRSGLLQIVNVAAHLLAAGKKIDLDRL